MMEPVLAPGEMRAADEACIAAGTPSDELMDRAAFACATVALRTMGGAYGRRVVVVAGKGNNGGDGIIAARHLTRAGVRCAVHRVGESWSPGDFEREARRAHMVVDAVFGTGFSGPARDAAADAIDAMARCGRPVLAVDIPSGVSGADGRIDGSAVRADVTVAIQALKPGHVLTPGALLCGRIEVADIAIPIGEPRTFVPGAADVLDRWPERLPDTHKYEAGVLVVLAGSAGMSGAAVLTARGAIRAGAGLVLLGVPRSSLEVVEAAVAEAVKLPLPDVEGQLDPKALDELGDRLEKARAFAIGPGIGRGPRAVALLRRVLEVSVPVVVDADGLTALAEILRDEPDVLRGRGTETVLTPHGGEFARLLGGPGGVSERSERQPPGEGSSGYDRLSAARDAAARLGAVVHLKGRRAVTASPDGRAWINTTGNPAMATGGTGDVLTGIVGALCAQGLGAADATWTGAWIHGSSGDVAAERGGTLAAGDVAAALPEALERVRWTHRASPIGTIRSVTA